MPLNVAAVLTATASELAVATLAGTESRVEGGKQAPGADPNTAVDTLLKCPWKLEIGL